MIDMISEELKNKTKTKILFNVIHNTIKIIESWGGGQKNRV